MPRCRTLPSTSRALLAAWHVETAQRRGPPAARRSPALDDLHGLVWKAWRRCRGVGAPPLRAPVRHAWSRCGEGTIDALLTDSRAEAHLHHPCLFRPAGAPPLHGMQAGTWHMPFAQFAPVRKGQEIENRPTVRNRLIRTRQVAALSRATAAATPRRDAKPRTARALQPTAGLRR